MYTAYTFFSKNTYCILKLYFEIDCLDCFFTNFCFLNRKGIQFCSPNRKINPAPMSGYVPGLTGWYIVLINSCVGIYEAGWMAVVSGEYTKTNWVESTGENTVGGERVLSCTGTGRSKSSPTWSIEMGRARHLSNSLLRGRRLASIRSGHRCKQESWAIAVPPIISRMGIAAKVKFCKHILSIDRDKSPLKISQKVAVVVLSEFSKIFSAPMYCTHLVVIFAIAKLSCLFCFCGAINTLNAWNRQLRNGAANALMHVLFCGGNVVLQFAYEL